MTPASSPPARLITIPISHFCEKARWALDRAGIAYREERHVQLVHRVAARRAGGSLTVPVFVEGERVLTESAAIVERALGPSTPDVARFVADLDAGLGPHGRRLMYDGVGGDRSVIGGYNCPGVPAWERRMFMALLPLGDRAIRRVLDITPETVVVSREACVRTLDEVGERLADGRRFLFGDAFSAADLTFAALAAPLVCPPQYTVPLPQPDEIPGAFRHEVRAWREHPAGAFALRMFAEER